VRNFEVNANKVEYNRESYDTTQGRGKPEVLIAKGVSSVKLLVPESKKIMLLRKKEKSSCTLL